MGKNRTPIIKSFGYAISGVLRLIKEERNAKIHAVAALSAISAGFYFDINLLEWTMVIIAIALVIITEAVNTVLENLLDHMHPERHPTVGKIKDMAAGAVLIAALAALIIGLLVFLPKLIALF